MICELCRANDYRKIYDVDGYTIVECKKCHLRRLNIISTSLREKNNTTVYIGKERLEHYNKHRYYYKKRYQQYIDIIQRLLPDKARVLDIGCNVGFFLYHCKANNIEAEGLEINASCMQEGKKRFNVNISLGDIEHYKGKNLFNMITLFDVLEHTQNPIKILQKTHRLLEKKGYVFIQLPNNDSYIANIKKEKWQWLCPGDHTFFFTKKTIIKALDQTNFKVVSIRTLPSTYGYDFNIKDYFNKTPLILKAKGLARAIIKSGFAILEPIEEYSQKGPLIQVIAQKK